MFEKEAEEWADEMYPCDGQAQRYLLMGAEFGYNKAKEEMQENGLALQSDMDKTIEQNIALKKELEKANEWHYVKDGDLPKETKNFLIYSEEWGGEIRKFFADVGYFECRKNTDVIAWKEIVLPEL